MVLGTILIIVVLANVVLTIILSQTRLTRHQIARIQAYYAAYAAMNLTFDQLRQNLWTTGAYSLCRAGCTVNDPDIPYRVAITVGPLNLVTGLRTITLATDYFYDPNL